MVTSILNRCCWVIHFTFDRHLIHSTDSETLLLTLPVAIMVGRTEIWCFWDVTPLQFHSHAFKIWEAFWFLFRNVLEEVQEMKEMHSKEDEWSSEEEDNTINREKQVLYSHLEDIKKYLRVFSQLVLIRGLSKYVNTPNDLEPNRDHLRMCLSMVRSQLMLRFTKNVHREIAPGSGFSICKFRFILVIRWLLLLADLSRLFIQNKHLSIVIPTVSKFCERDTTVWMPCLYFCVKPTRYLIISLNYCM